MPAKPTAAPINLAGLDALDTLGTLSFESLINSDRDPARRANVDAQLSAIPMMVSITDVEEQPHQVRKRFQLDDMRASIRENRAAGRPPIKTPLIVKAMQGKPGKWELWDGARRLRSAQLEGVDELPIIVDEHFDDFDQVVVNLQRDGNTPVEIADFIGKKLTEGFKKSDIAKRLGVSNSWVSKHASLIDMPASVRQAYDQLRMNDVEAMYLLVTSYKEFGTHIDQLCTEAIGTISKYTVMKLIDDLKAAHLPPVTPTGSITDSPALPLAGAAAAQPGRESEPNTVVKTGVGPASPLPCSDTNRIGEEQLENRSPKSRTPGTESSEPIGAPQIVQLLKPVIRVSRGTREATLLMVPCGSGSRAWVRYEDNGEHAQIDIDSLKLLAIFGEK